MDSLPQGRQVSGRRPSTGIAPQSSSRNSSETFDRFQRDPLIVPHTAGARRAQHDEDAAYSLHDIPHRDGDQRRTLPMEQRAPPRHDSFRYLPASTARSPKNSNTSNQPQNFRRRQHGSSETGTRASVLSDDATSVDSVLFQAVDNLYGPDHTRSRSRNSSNEPDSSTGTDEIHFQAAPSNVFHGDIAQPSQQEDDAPSDLFQGDIDYPSQQVDGDGVIIPEDSIFAVLCNEAGTLQMNKDHTEQDYIEHDLSWNAVRSWLESHHVSDLQLALEVRDNKGRTAMHCACQNQPPLDVIAHILQYCPACLQATDLFDWSPLHYACAFAASPSVLHLIAETYGAAKTIQTNRGLTPLHLALIGPFRDFSDSIAVLASTGAASIADDEGILPLHYACAFGATEETIRILVARFPKALSQKDLQGRDPLIFAIANTKTNPKRAPKVVALLLDLTDIYVPAGTMFQTTEDSSNPLQFLANFVSQIEFREGTQEMCASIKECLPLLLNYSEPTPTVLSTLRTFPGWLLPTAVLSPHVQHILDEKIKDKFPTVLLMVDFYMQVMIILSLHFGLEASDKTARDRCAIGLFVGGSYFQLREFIQIFTLIWFGSFRTFLLGWLFHFNDMLDQLYIFAVITCGVFIFKDTTTDQVQKIVMTFSAGIFWAKLFIWMRSIKVDFSVFVSGVFYVSRAVLPYVQGIIIFLVAFTQMFITIFRSSGTYGCNEIDSGWSAARDYYKENEDEFIERQCGNIDNFRPFCNYWVAFLHVLTMFLGEVDEAFFADSDVGVWLYVIFVFIMVILLANVLIAIVTNSYKFIQDSEATMVFYTNRLHFLSETDAISNFPFFRQLFSLLDSSFDDDKAGFVWDNLFSVFAFKSEYSILYGTHWTLRIIPLLIAIITIPSWLILGAMTCGLLWPPQVREWIFASTIWKSESKAQEEKDQHERRETEKRVAAEVAVTREEFYQRLSENRQQYSEIKASVIERKQEIRVEMKRIRVLMSNLFEQAEHLRSQREARQSDSDSESY